MFKTKKKKKIKVEKQADKAEEEKHREPTNLLQLTDDCLLVLFAAQLTLLEGLQLGSTCRRLYGLYRDSWRNRRSLVLYRHDLHYVSWLDDSTVDECLWDNDYYDDCFNPPPIIDLPPPPPPSLDYLRLLKYDKLAALESLFARLPNLLCLEIRDVEDTEQALFLLVAALNGAAWHTKLQSLKLHFRQPERTFEFDSYDEDDENDDGDEEMVPPTNTTTTTAPIIIFEEQQLQLPSLKHLSLCLHKNIDSPIVQLVFHSPLLFLSVLPQLTSFSLSAANGCVAEGIRFLREHIFSSSSSCPQLAAAAGTPALQVAFVSNAENFSSVLLPGLPISYGKPVESTDQKVLECITRFYVTNGHDMTDLTLPKLVNLRKVSVHLLDAKSAGIRTHTYYPRLLKSLATLRHLEVLEVTRIADLHQSHTNHYRGFFEKDDVDWGEEHASFVRRSLPTLPSVRTLLLTVNSAIHEDPLEFFHLERCFPGLKQISVTFCQAMCEYCAYNALTTYTEENAACFHRCALRLARGLLRCGGGASNGASPWESSLKVAKLSVAFFHQGILYDSLESLVAGQHKINSGSFPMCSVW